MKTYTLQGLDCASCAAVLEKTLAAHPGVTKVSIDFPTLTMKIEAQNMEEVEKLIKKEEPDVQLRPQGNGVEEAPEGFFKTWGILILSVFLTVAGLVWEHYKLPLGGPWTLPLWFVIVWVLAGSPVIVTAFNGLFRGKWMDENFLMTFATIGAFFLGEWEEAVGVMIFYRIGETLQELAVAKSRKTIKALASLQSDTARLLKDGAWTSVPAAALSPGEEIQLHPGELVPVDSLLLTGQASFDTAALTGESLPKHLSPGSEIPAGYVNISGLLTLKVQKSQGQSAVSRIMEQVESALHRKSKREKFITRFARWYTPGVVLGALALGILPPLFMPGESWGDWLHKSLILLVISCPCALVLGIPLTYFAGLGAAAKEGILFKGSESLEALGQVKNLTFDKTGTLTEGTFALRELHPAGDTTEEQLLALGVEAEGPSPHPLAHSLRKAWSGLPLPLPEAFTEMPGHGVKATWGARILLAGNKAMMELHGLKPRSVVVDYPAGEIHVAENGIYKGVILLGDREKPGTPGALVTLKTMGMKSLGVLSGDSPEGVESATRHWNLDFRYGGLLPGEKLSRLEERMKEYPGVHGFVGDGINDSPVLARADVGIALGAGSSQAAMEAADVGIQSADPRKIPQAIGLARRVQNIALQNISLALGIKAGVLLLGVLGTANLWLAVLADSGAALIVAANALRALKAPGQTSST